MSKLPHGIASLRHLYRSYRRRASKSGREFTLTLEEFHFLTKKPCYICNKPPTQRYRCRTRDSAYIYNGLDRIDNKKGYVLDNVLPCCKICNVSKASLSLLTLLKHFERVLRLWGDTNACLLRARAKNKNILREGFNKKTRHRSGVSSRKKRNDNR